METRGVTPRPYKTSDGTIRFMFTLFYNGTDYVFKNLADETTAVKYRMFLRRLKIKLGRAFDPIPYQIHHSEQEPLTEDAVTGMIERARIGHIPPAAGLLLVSDWATSVTRYQVKDGTSRYGFTLDVRSETHRTRGKTHIFRGFKSEEEAIAARLRLVTLREQLGTQFNPTHYQRHRTPDAPLLLPLRPKGLGRLDKTFGEFAYEWMEKKRGAITPTRWKLMRAQLQASVLQQWAYRELKTIDKDAFQCLIDHLLSTHASCSVANIGSTVASILVAAQAAGHVQNTFHPYSLLHGLR